MEDFEGIRPYLDHEVVGVLESLVANPELRDAVAGLRLPGLKRLLPPLARQIVGWELKRRTRGLETVRDVQLMLEGYVDALVEQTTSEFSVRGLDRLEVDRAYLFISNHRDIVMDSAFLNLAIHRAGHQTSRIAVGDNLLSRAFATDLMRLNKSFVVERSVKGTKAVYAALHRTSSYIRCSLSEGHSVWIAQREGRAKDGFDRTDPALLKMLALAWRKEIEHFGDMCQRISIVPVSVSYELDPCDRRKAHELCVTQTRGGYEKTSDEDLMSIVDGILGEKGRVHLTFGKPMQGSFQEAEDLAIAVDECIIGGLEIFPTNVEAARLCGLDVANSQLEPLPGVMASFRSRIESTSEAERRFLLEQYTNPIRNQLSL
ncbi:MAG: 1-acyl-sn-glycerol-3-phosphate acyltransferase [Pseudomonadales bacterium]|jgi:1-acyl-sn-glycerol-3-phosphate acyltransferase|nr:1-acyl-sn-glycerol-3-phosphate acyltransferase [Pseudomonadales bacterium]MDP6470724.1 1-acyl-sn-glycerol-3-phosphate acyltransferase [Pseudomonadales bacterium]MDP6828324.1 1-acyl-sn-glycerol-3-phosphate acyltransferase [Pseudomonadales bacterium]MDP6972126.1 1-acyl-sn-glycerol-3-phosphate acyltransferase [Pseudomonadales bacterium]|tara:strand:- start:999 stop:2120 length:1122 start_codon:yes stop_codon:yes gene_type:complete